MAKESLFNILDNQYYFEGLQVLDLFAGTGNISLEFISRGVDHVLSIESHPKVIKHLNKIQTEWEVDNWSILRKDAIKFLNESGKQFNIIFADPPFNMKETADLPQKVLEAKILKEEGIFILEHGQENSFDNHPNLIETRRYGGVYFSFFN